MNANQFSSRISFAQSNTGPRQVAVLADTVFQVVMNREPNLSDSKDSEQIAIISETISLIKPYMFKDEYKDPR